MIKLIKNTFYNEFVTKLKLALFILRSKHLSFGKQCELFESRFSNYQGRKHCVMVNSGSSANLALIQSLLNLGRLKKGDRVGFSALTWSTNVMPLIQLGLKPVPIDVELDTLNVSSITLGRKRLKALFLTNALGLCDDINKIKEVCDKRGIILLEDNCESLGTVYEGVKLGNFGLASTFSFYVGHHLSTIEGGAICTDDDDLATMLRIVRAHGWDRNLDLADKNGLRKKFKVNSSFYSRYTFYDLGFNLRPTEIAGYSGNIQLDLIDEIVMRRQDNFMALFSPEYLPLRYEHMETVSSFAIPLICKTKKQRDNLVKRCRGKIEIRPIIGGDITQQPFYLKYVGSGSSPNAKFIHERGLYIGNNPDMTMKDINTILEVI